MSKVALVTGGTRGIGEAISVMLKEDGFTVAANYAGNEERAKAFTDRTASSPTSSTSQISRPARMSRSDRGRPRPGRCLVNNAGITRDGTIHKMDHDMWQSVIDTNLGSCFKCAAA